MYGLTNKASLHFVAVQAANSKTGENPPYTLEDFFAMYPTFAPRRKPDEETGDAMQVETLVPLEVMELYLDFAHACIKEARWHKSWRIAMGWFIAHFLTLYLKSMTQSDAAAKKVIAAGQANGLPVSKSVQDVSVSYDYSTAVQGLNGWAMWTLTSYGQQLAALARLIGKGGMYVW